jgi:purine/pyrimidine-nucleoside phosphorylase
MINVNEYFDGKVKSLTLNGVSGKETVGVMLPGEYEFGTSQKEVMTVVSGALVVKLPGETEFEVFQADEAFEIPANSKFQLKVFVETAYLCQYL